MSHTPKAIHAFEICSTPPSANMSSVQLRPQTATSSGACGSSPVNVITPRTTTPTSSSASRIVIKRRVPLRSVFSSGATRRTPVVERVIPIVSEQSGKVIVGNIQTVRENATNGRIWKPHPAKPNIPSGLTITTLKSITPVRNITPLVKPNNMIESPAVVQKVIQAKTVKEKVTVCGKCSNCSKNTNKCDYCHTVFHEGDVKCYVQCVKAPDTKVNSPLTPKTSGIPKQLFYSNPLQASESIVHSSPGIHPKVIIMADKQGMPKSRPRNPRSKAAEPVCLTISSDEEDSTNGEAATPGKETLNSHTCHSSNNIQEEKKLPLETKRASLRSQQPANVPVVNAKLARDVEEKIEAVEEEEPEIDEEMLEEEEGEGEEPPAGEDGDEDEDEEGMPENNVMDNKILDNCIPLFCRSIRVGSYKVHPLNDDSHITVYINENGFYFEVPTVSNPHEIVPLCLKAQDLVFTLGHFGRCLPIMFVYASPHYGETVRKKLGMVKGDPQYYDPSLKDEKQKHIVFLIDSLNDDHRRFFRSVFPGEARLKEVDQKMANEILVRSTPNQNQLVRCQTSTFPGVQQSVIHVPSAVLQSPPIQITPLKHPNVEVTKLLTYPPPPQTGGIPITSEDIICLDEGEFLNDVIIDFYLKYLMLEKLSETDRKRTHIFSSFFYPRLTQKPVNRGGKSGESGPNTIQVKRHGQVKTWTRHLDIFEKDFIIIPINQNVHWFLAIICYPGLVPEAPPPSATPSSKDAETQFSADTVSSTNDQGSCQPCDNISSQISKLSSPSDIKTKDQACNTDDSCNSAQSSPDDSLTSSYGAGAAFCTEEPLPDVPDSSTHPDVQTSKKKPCILIFDSLSGPSRWRIANTLREYLEVEWRIKKGTRRVFDRTTMQGFVPRVPQQTNFSDCGIYVLQYVESFFENPLPHFGSPMPKLHEWFSEEKVANKRNEIKSLIFELQKRYKSSSSSTSACSSSTPSSSSTVNANKSDSVSKEQGKAVLSDSGTIHSVQLPNS